MSKSGYKTSEFILVVVALVLVLANQAGFIGQPISSEALLSISGLVSSYAVGRGLVKRRGQ